MNEAEPMRVEEIILRVDGRTIKLRPKHPPTLAEVIKAYAPESPLAKGIKRQEPKQ